MKNSTKITLIILSTVSVILLLIYSFLGMIGKNTPQEVIYPDSNLSQSIFDSQRQNMTYTANASLTEVYSYTHCPYQFDTVNGETAHVGENGCVFEVTEGYLLFTTEFPEAESASNILKTELSNVVLIDATPENSALENNVYEEGYINGFKASYRIDTLSVSDGSDVKSVYLVGYELSITEEEANHGYKIYLGVIINADVTEQYNTASVILNNVLHTYQYNEDLQTALDQAEEKEAKQTALEEKKESDELEANQTGAYEGVEGASGTLQTAEDIPQRSTKSVQIDQDYREVVLTYSYSNIGNDVQAVLYNPDHTQKYEPTTSGEGFIKFSLSHMEAGTWIIEIDGDPGTDNMKLAISSKNPEDDVTSSGMETSSDDAAPSSTGEGITEE